MRLSLLYLSRYYGYWAVILLFPNRLLPHRATHPTCHDDIVICGKSHTIHVYFNEGVIPCVIGNALQSLSTVFEMCIYDSIRYMLFILAICLLSFWLYLTLNRKCLWEEWIKVYQAVKKSVILIFRYRVPIAKIGNRISNNFETYSSLLYGIIARKKPLCAKISKDTNLF